ncbi:hypothetical protein [Croceicoccus sp. Ery15]|uniref:hypothetical protein n=1 Tax=Croceicoccus sp. Ery15 TaxID=1703338 RepID=UPI001E560085|nr:hypothetical protein [Croceicoccus sp. Ery15]
MNRKRFDCPECETKAGVPIIYGYPSQGLIKRAKRGEVILGGCMQEINAPNRSCQNCEHRWIDDQRSV